MNIKKTVAIAAAAGALAAISVPAMALENEFHGMYKFMGYQSNIFNGTTFNAADRATILSKDAGSGFMAEQRARLQYTAKASADLKLVTHFELDARFGGKPAAYLGTASGNDGGNLDADQLTLETKNIYLDVNDPFIGANVKVGIQPWVDSYQGAFLLADMAGVYATKKRDALTASLGWFRVDDNTPATLPKPGKFTTDLIVADAKYAVSKDIKVGGSYYNIQNDAGVAPAAGGDVFELLHMVGVNADMAFGPATVKPFFAYQFGDVASSQKLNAFAAGAVAKVKAGPGAINASALYLSGDNNGTGDSKDFKAIAAANAQYFNAANMWLIVRNGQGINSSSSVLGNDMTVSGRGFAGLFAGYEGTVDKLFYNANIGYAQTAETRKNAAGVKEDGTIGTEINATVGYKVYDNLSASAAVAYAFLGDGLKSKTAGKRIDTFGAADADNPYLINLQLSYTF